VTHTCGVVTHSWFCLKWKKKGKKNHAHNTFNYERDREVKII
jgi:hypothetical protein